jgi:ABC-type branched-subunit amino acid transport system substrate-binding protein
MLRRAFILLLGTLGLAACGHPDTGAPTVINQPPGSSLGGAPPGASGPVAILLPLTGKMADLGKPMLQAAQLSLSYPGSPILDVKDTRGTPEGAAQAAREAIDNGAKLILGPVTSAETAQVAPIARQAGIPVLAFTNDNAQAQPGVWTLGITPSQQVRRLLGAIRDTQKGPVAALLPDNDFGKAMGDALTRAVSAEGQPAPFLRMVGPGKDDIVSAVNEVAALAGPDQPPPYGAILLGAVGNDLRIYAKAFADAKIDRGRVQILGPALWGSPASGSSALIGAWYAAPTSDARGDLVREYTAKYREPPSPLADLANDAGSIARVLAAQGRMNTAGLTQPAGFAGADGWLALMPDGQVRRGLAVFRIERGRAVKLFDAPAGPTLPGS